jgi:hypothetical protein
MALAGTGDELAQLLTTLKDRSGLSYSELGRRTHTSSSTLHRYCTGKTIPPDYQTVVRIATACEATDNDLVELLRRWRQAANPDVVHYLPEPSSLPVRRHGQRLASAAAVLLTVILLVSAANGPQAQFTGAAQQIDGPSWQRERLIEPSLFGVTASSSSGSMPAFRVGSLRFWDSRTRWANLQPRPDEYDWSTLDRLVGAAQQAGLPATFVFGGTPAWAAPNGPKAPYDDGSRAAPPDQLAHWDRFITTLVTRYRGRIEAYEVWVHANDPRYYSGSTETLVEMTQRASRAIKAVDPKAVVVCPSMARLGTAEGREVLRRFAELRGYDHCDVAGLKLHQRQASDPPEFMVELLQQTYDALHDAGVHPPLWNTGVTYEYARDERLDEQRAINYATRFYLVAIYGTNVSLKRTYFYNWGGSRLPIALQAVGGPPTRAALAVEELQRWLSHATTRSCGHGLAINLPSNVWQCEFTAQDRRLLVIRWTHSGTATTVTAPDVEELRHIDGTGRPLRAGDAVPVSETPVLIVHRRP